MVPQGGALEAARASSNRGRLIALFMRSTDLLVPQPVRKLGSPPPITSVPDTFISPADRDRKLPRELRLLAMPDREWKVTIPVYKVEVSSWLR